MKRQTLNEEVSRIKEMMGCIKNNLNEVAQLSSQQESQMAQAAVADIENLGITQQDVEENTNDPKLNNVKEKIANETLNPFLQKATKEDLKAALKELIQYKRELSKQINSNSQQDTIPDQTPVNEQVMNAAGQIRPGSWLAKLFGPLDLAMKTAGDALGYVNIYMIVTWMICSIFKCYLYSLSDYNTNIVNRIVALLAWDFKNVFTREQLVKGCGRMF
jgi:hypothetical protein